MCTSLYLRVYTRMHDYMSSQHIQSSLSLCAVAQTGNDQLPADLENDIKEYHCLQAYLVCSVLTSVTVISCV